MQKAVYTKLLTDSLIGYLARIKLNTSYLMQEFEVEVKRLQHLKASVIDSYIPRVEVTPRNTGEQNIYHDESKVEMLREYLFHVLQYSTPEERVKILKGVNSRFILSNRQLSLS